MKMKLLLILKKRGRGGGPSEPPEPPSGFATELKKHYADIFC